MKTDIYNTNKKYSIIYADPPWSYNDKGCFCIKGYPYKSYFNNPAIDVVMNEDCIEIIGNIHDNPELLKEADNDKL